MCWTIIQRKIINHSQIERTRRTQVNWTFGKVKFKKSNRTPGQLSLKIFVFTSIVFFKTIFVLFLLIHLLQTWEVMFPLSSLENLQRCSCLPMRPKYCHQTVLKRIRGVYPSSFPDSKRTSFYTLVKLFTYFFFVFFGLICFFFALICYFLSKTAFESRKLKILETPDESHKIVL